MKYALVIVEVPENIWRKDSLLVTNFSSHVLDKMQSNESTSVIAPSVFLCDMQYGLHDVNTIVATAKARDLSTRTLFFDHDPSWITSK